MTKISNDAVYIVDTISDLDSLMELMTLTKKKLKFSLGQLKAYFKSGFRL
jgi:hypothetical protein